RFPGHDSEGEGRLDYHVGVFAFSRGNPCRGWRGAAAFHGEGQTAVGLALYQLSRTAQGERRVATRLARGGDQGRRQRTRGCSRQTFRESAAPGGDAFEERPGDAAERNTHNERQRRVRALDQRGC